MTRENKVIKEPSWSQVAAVVDRLAGLLSLGVGLFAFFHYLYPLLKKGLMKDEFEETSESSKDMSKINVICCNLKTIP